MTSWSLDPALRRRLLALRSERQAARQAARPADRSATERVITNFYRLIGRPPPRFLWFDGPVSCMIAANLVEQHERPQPEADLSRLIQDELSGLCRGLRREAMSQHPELAPILHVGPFPDHIERAFQTVIVDTNRKGRLWRQIDDLFGVEHWARFCERLQRLTGIRFSTASIHSIRQRQGFWNGHGQNFADHHLEYKCLGVQFDGVASSWLDEMADFQRAAGWWLPCERNVFCAERFLQLGCDAAQRLHNEQCPAIECRDGLKIYAWHGVSVPAQWIEGRATLDPWTALTWPNIEQRRAASEIIGWARILERVPTRVVDAHADPQIGTLLECVLPNAGPSRFLRVRCATGRTFVLSVPRDVTTALAANAWTYGLNENDYQLEARS